MTDPAEFAALLWAATSVATPQVVDVGTKPTDELFGSVRRELPVAMDRAVVRRRDAEMAVRGPGHARELMDGGWTLFLEDADRRLPAVRDLRLALVALTGHPFLHATLYAALPGADPARPPHTDPGPAAVVQLSGTKRWTAGDLRVQLRPGQVLLMPAGTEHHAAAVDDTEASVHLTVTFLVPGLAAVARAVERLGWMDLPGIYRDPAALDARLDHLRHALGAPDRAEVPGSADAGPELYALVAALDERADTIDLLVTPGDLDGALLRRAPVPVVVGDGRVLVAGRVLELATPAMVGLAARVARLPVGAVAADPMDVARLGPDERQVLYGLCVGGALECEYRGDTGPTSVRS